MTSATDAATPADAQFVHDEWDRRTRAHDIEGLVDLYLPDATLESPLVPRILDQDSGVLRGHDELRRFFVKVMELNGPHIAHHRIYWGWYGAPLLERPR